MYVFLIRHAAVNGTYGSTLRLLMKTDTLRAFIGYDVVDVHLLRCLRSGGIGTVAAESCKHALHRGAIGKAPFCSAFVYGIVRTFGLTRPTIDAFVSDLDGHGMVGLPGCKFGRKDSLPIMNHQQRTDAFLQLGKVLEEVAAGRLSTSWDETIIRAGEQNKWFTDENVRLALRGISRMLTREKLDRWLAPYGDIPEQTEPKSVGIIMAGNIPLVGFHDLLTVLITGNKAVVKTSSQDDLLPRKLVETLVSIDPHFADLVTFTEGRMSGFSHIIATGSTNSSRYFDYYFSRYPSIIRRNRNSVAVITGNETDEELRALGKDIFRFFGLGCRNVSKLYVHVSVEVADLLRHFEGWKHIIEHNKYCNNYEYHKAIYLVERMKHLDTGFLLVREDAALSCPVGVLHYETFTDMEGVKRALIRDADATQCVVATTSSSIPQAVAFGRSQEPEVWEYADDADTVAFLMKNAEVVPQ